MGPNAWIESFGKLADQPIRVESPGGRAINIGRPGGSVTCPAGLIVAACRSDAPQMELGTPAAAFGGADELAALTPPDPLPRRSNTHRLNTLVLWSRPGAAVSRGVGRPLFCCRPACTFAITPVTWLRPLIALQMLAPGNV